MEPPNMTSSSGSLEVLEKDNVEEEEEEPIKAAVKPRKGVRGRRLVVSDNKKPSLNKNKSDVYTTNLGSKLFSLGTDSTNSDIDDDDCLLTETYMKKQPAVSSHIITRKSLKDRDEKNTEDIYLLSSDSDSENCRNHENLSKRDITPPPSPVNDINGLPQIKKQKRMPRALKKAIRGLQNMERSMQKQQLDSLNTSLNTSSSQDLLLEVEERPLSVKIRVASGKTTHRFPMRMYDSFRDAIRKLAILEKVSVSDVLLLLGEKTIHPYDTPESVGLNIADIIDCHFKTSSTDSQGVNNSLLEDDPDVIHLQVQAKNARSRCRILTRLTDPMECLMKEFARQHNVDADTLTFTFDGETIEPSNTPEELDLDDSFCIDVTGV